MQCLIRRAINTVTPVGRRFLPVAVTETAPTLLWPATTQSIESKQNPPGLAPKSCFVSAEAIEREVGQIGETQKATREVSGAIDGRFDRNRP